MVSMVMLNLGGKPMKITFSLITKKIFHADTSYLGQIMSINWAFLRKCNCDLGPRPRSPDGRSNPPKTGIELSKYITYAPVVMFDTTYVRLLLIWIFSFILILSIHASELG